MLIKLSQWNLVNILYQGSTEGEKDKKISEEICNTADGCTEKQI